MTCPETVCTVTPRPPQPPAPPKLAPQLGVDPITETTLKVTSCSGCDEIDPPQSTQYNGIERVIVMGVDECVTPPAPPQVVYESTKTVTLSQSYTKSDCDTGTGSVETYETEATATAYSIISQADADVKAQSEAMYAAQQDITNNGQAYANLYGTCT